MNIATSKPSAPIEKQASVYDAALEYLGSGGLSKLLPKGLAGNHALAAGAGALGSDVTRRILRSRGLGDASSSAAGSLVGLGLGGLEGGAGAIAALHPAVRGRTAETGIRNLLGTTALLAGGEHLGKLTHAADPSVLASRLYKATEPFIPAPGLIDKLLATPEALALQEKIGPRLSAISNSLYKDITDPAVYARLGTLGVGTAAAGAGLRAISPARARELQALIKRTPREAALGLGGLALAAAGAPALGAGGVLAGLAANKRTQEIARRIYNATPRGALPATLGGGAALMGAPVIGASLAAGGLMRNQGVRQAARGATTQVARGYKSLPKGSILGSAGLAATVGGMPALGVPTMLAAPFYNPRSSRFIGDVARELRAPAVQAREAQKTKEVIDGLYKKSSYSIKLAAPVYRTTPAYCLDAPTMDKVAFLPQMYEAGVKFLSKNVGKAQRSLAKGTSGALGFGGRTRLLDRSAKALQRGAQESGNVLTTEQARRQAELFMRQDAGLGTEVVARNVPKPGTRAAYADVGTQYEGTLDAIDQQVNKGTDHWTRFIPFRNYRLRAQNRRQIEQRMYEYGRTGATPASLTANTEASAKAQAELTQAQQAANRAKLKAQDLSTGYTYTNPDGTMAVVPGVEGAQREVTRLTAPVEAAQQNLTQAEQAAQQARNNYFRTHFGIDAPTKTVEQLEQEIRTLDGFIANGDVARKPARAKLQAQLDALQATERAQGVTSQPGLSTTRLKALSAQDEAAVGASYNQLKQDIAARAAGGNPPTLAQQNQLKLFEEYMQLRPATYVTQVAAEGSAEIASVVNILSGSERSQLGLIKRNGVITNSPAEIRQNIINKITELEASPGTNDALLAKLKGAEVTVTTPGNVEFIGEGYAGLQTRLQEMQQNLQRQKAYGDVVTAEAVIDPLRAPLQQAQEALSPAQQALNKARVRLNNARSRVKAHELTAERATQARDAARASEKATADLLGAPVANPVASKLDAPVLKTVAEGGAKPQVVEVLSARGIEGIAPGMEEQLRLLEAAGQNTGKMVNSAAKRSGLPKAVTQVNKAADQLVNEAVANLNLSPQELEAVQNAVRQMSSRGGKLDAAGLKGLVPGSNANTDQAFTAIEALVNGVGNSSRQYTEASQKLTESFKQFGRELGTEFSAAQELAANASYSGMRKGVQAATEQPGRLKRLFTGRRKGLGAEDVEAIEAVEALTSARVQAIETVIAGQGGNAALAQAARPQLYAASEAVARSGSPDIARAWARALQEPGSLAKSIEANPSLKALIEKEAPELLKANNKAFNLSVEQAGELQSLIPRTGRGGSAESIAKELELGFKPETLRDTASPRAQESLQAMRSADDTFGRNMEGLITSSEPAKNSVAGKILSGTDDVGKLTFDEVAALDGVAEVKLDASVIPAFSGNNARIAAANKELAALRTNSTIEESLAYIDKELKSIPQPRRGAAVDPRREALEDARTVIADQLKTSNREFNAGYATHMRQSRKALETTLKQDSRVDVSQLRRNTDVAKVKVEKSTMDKLYQQPILDESGNLVFNEADLTKQLEHLSSLRGNANVPQEVLQARVIEENLARLKDAGADQQLLNNARANLESLLQASSVDALAQGGSRGGGGMFAGLATVGAAGVGGGAMANRRPGPATQARQQVRASWGLSPLHAPVIQSKLAAAVKPIPLKATQPKLPKADKLPAQSLLTATVEGQERAMKMSSLLAAPVGGRYYGHV